jgi:hypothetical protein
MLCLWRFTGDQVMTPEIISLVWLQFVIDVLLAVALYITIKEIARLQDALREITKCAIHQATNTNELAQMVRKIAVERIG